MFVTHAELQEMRDEHGNERYDSEIVDIHLPGDFC
jgi:hypothetical protein